MSQVGEARNRLGATETLDARLRAARPAAPHELAGRCAPGEPVVLRVAPPAGAQHSLRRRLLTGGGGLAAAAVVVLVILYALPASPVASAAAARAMRAALDELTQVRAVRLELLVDGAEGLVHPGPQVALIDAELGMRLEGDEGVVVYSARRMVQFEYRRADNRVREIRYSDPIDLQEELRRIRPDQNVEMLRAVALQARRPFTDELIDEGELRVRRIRTTDDAGRPIVVELDPQSQRVLRTEAWTIATEAGPGARIRTRYEYPDGFDAALFESPAPADAARETASMTSAARTECLVHVRNLCMMVHLYAQEHERQLPRSFEDLRRYAQKPDECAVCPNSAGAPLTVRHHFAELGERSVNDLTATTALFTVDLEDGRIVGYGDGHAEFHAR